jgi:23S rRNA (guanosine2251-2'-O)-methyltransferase
LSVPSTSYKDTIECIDHLRRDGFQVWAIDYTQRSTPLQDVVELPPKLAFVVGNERAGVDPVILEQADRHIHLDMYGAKTTLNVGVTFGTVAYWLRAIAIVA